MLLLFLVFKFCKSATTDPYSLIPKIKFLYVYGSYTDEEIDEMQKEEDERYKENMAECRKYSSKKMCETIYGMITSVYSNGNDFDNDLRKIEADIDMLFITTNSFSSKEVDFNSLKGSMVVYFQSTSYSYSKILSKEEKLNEALKQEKRMIRKIAKFINKNGNLKDAHKFIQTLLPKEEKTTKALSSVSIVGGIKNKVSLLYVANFNVQIVKSDLDCFYASFILCSFNYDTKKIKSTYLLVDKQSHNSLYMDDVDVNQYTLYLLNINTNYDSDETFYRVSYWNEEWRTYFKSIYSSYYSNMDLNVPYTSAKSFGIIAVTLHIDIYRDDNDDIISTVKDVNVSIIGNLNVPSESKKLEKEKIYITSTGWEGQSTKPKVVITTDKNAYDVDSSQAKDLKIDVQDQFVYKPKSEEKKKKTNVGLIVGVVVGVVVVIVVIVIIVVVVKKKKKIENSSNEENNPPNNSNESDSKCTQQNPNQLPSQDMNPNNQGGYPNQQVGYPNQQGGYYNQQGGYPNQQYGYYNQQGGYPNQQYGYPNQQGGYPNQQGGYPNQQGGYPNQQGGYPNQPSSYQNQPENHPIQSEPNK